MGVLEIGKRSASLGNLGDVRSVDTNTGAVEAAERVAQSVRSANQMRIRAAGGKYLMGQAIGNGLKDLGNGIASLSQDGMKMLAIDDAKKADEFVSKYQDGMDGYNNGRRGGSVGGGTDEFAAIFKDGMEGFNQGETGQVGALNEPIKDSEAWMKKNVDFRENLEAKLKEKLGLSDRQLELARRRLEGYNRSLMNGWASRKFKVDNARELGNAKDCWDMANRAVVAENADPKSWQEWEQSGNRLLDTMQVFGDQERKAFFLAQAEKIAGIGVTKMIRNAQDETLDWEDADAVRARWNQDIEILKGADKYSFLPPSSWITVEDENGNAVYEHGKLKRRNILAEKLDGADIEGLKKAAIQDFTEKRISAENHADSVFRQNRYQSRQDAEQDEITWRQQADYAELTYLQRAQHYDELCQKNSIEGATAAGHAQFPLEKYDKAAYITYSKLADYWRKQDKASKAKGEREETTEAKQARTELEASLELDALKYLVEPEGLTDGERQEWLANRRDFTVRVIDEFNGKRISPAKARSLISTMDKHYTAEEKEQARSFLEFFGFDRESYQTLGQAEKAVATHTGDTPEPIGEHQVWGFLWNRDTNVSNEDCLKLYNTYMKYMKAMPKGADKEAYTRRCLDKVAEQAADWNVDKIIEYFSTEGTSAANAETVEQAKSLKRQVEERKQKGKK